MHQSSLEKEEVLLNTSKDPKRRGQVHSGAKRCQHGTGADLGRGWPLRMIRITEVGGERVREGRGWRRGRGLVPDRHKLVLPTRKNGRFHAGRCLAASEINE